MDSLMMKLCNYRVTIHELALDLQRRTLGDSVTFYQLINYTLVFVNKYHDSTYVNGIWNEYHHNWTYHDELVTNREQPPNFLRTIFSGLVTMK